MAKRSTLLRALLRERHWQKYATFCKEYDKAAERIDPSLVGTAPSRGQFTRWLAGDLKGVPHPDHCRVLEAMFPGLSAQQLFAPVETALPASAATNSITVAGSRVVGSMPPTHSPRLGDDVPFEEGGGQGIHAATGDLLGEEIVMATEESARFVRRARGTVDQDVLDQLDADVRRLAVDYLARPPYAMIRPLASLRSEVFEMLEAHQRPRVLPGLYRVAGQLCALLAHAAADLGNAYAADTDTRAAWLCADLGEDNPLRAFVRWVQSNVAYWNGDFRTAAEIAHSGQRYATSGTSLLRLASQEARALAAAGNQREVEPALATAMAARDQLGQVDEAGVFNFEPGKAAYYASEVRLALGGEDNFRRAATEAQDALDLFNAAPEGDRCPEFLAAAQLDLCAAHLALQDLEAADAHLKPVLRLPAESRTRPVAQRMAKADRLIAGPTFAGNTLAADLREQVALFCAYTAARDLPAELPR